MHPKSIRPAEDVNTLPMGSLVTILVVVLCALHGLDLNVVQRLRLATQLHDRGPEAGRPKVSDRE